MTRRRDLELAVIEAARAVDGHVDFVSGDMAMGNLSRAILELDRALAELDKLREVEKPRASRVAPITSHQAAAWVATSTQRSMLGKIFYKIYWSDHPFIHDRFGDTRFYQRGRTADELIVELHRGHATVSARVNELANAGWIVDSGMRRPTRSGRDAVVWVVSAEAKGAIDEGRRL